MDTYEGYLGAIGFNGGQQQQQGTSFAQSDAARQTGDVQRQLALAKADLENAGSQERQGINYDYEDRGLFNSGLRGQSLAVQQGNQANKTAQLEAGAAADVGNIQSGMQKQLASERAQQAQEQADQQMTALQLQYQNEQIGTQRSMAAQQQALAQAQLDAQKKIWEQQLELARQAARSNGG